MSSTLFAAIRGENIITIKSVEKARGRNNVVAVISPDTDGYWLSIHERNPVGYMPELTQEGWLDLEGQGHKGIGAGGSKGYIYAKCFREQVDALNALHQFFSSNQNPHSIIGSDYHGQNWPSDLPAILK